MPPFRLVLLGYFTKRLYEFYIFSSFSPHKDYIRPVPSWVLRLSLRSEPQTCTSRLRAFVCTKHRRPELEMSTGPTSTDGGEVFQAPQGGAKTQQEILVAPPTPGRSRDLPKADCHLLLLLERDFPPCVEERITPAWFNILRTLLCRFLAILSPP